MNCDFIYVVCCALPFVTEINCECILIHYRGERKKKNREEKMKVGLRKQMEKMKKGTDCRICMHTLDGQFSSFKHIDI